MKKQIPLLLALFLYSCGGIETPLFEATKPSKSGKGELLKIISDPKDSLHYLGGRTYEIEVDFSAPVDEKSITGNVFVFPVLGDAVNGENVLGDGIPVMNFKSSPDRTRFFFLFSVDDGDYVLYLSRNIKDLAGNQLDGRCDLKNEPSDAVSSGFMIGNGKGFKTLAFCQPSPVISFMVSPGNNLTYGDHRGCDGETNVEFTKEPVFIFAFSFPTGTTENYILAEDLQREIEIYDLTVDVRRPIYFSLDHGVSWKDDITKFGVNRITDNYYVYIKPIPLDGLHRFALRINRFGGLKDRFGIPFWDGSPDEDNVYEVCFTTRGERETLKVGGIEIKRENGWITGIKVWFDTPSNENENMDYETLITENFYVYDISEGKPVPFDLQVHRETVIGKERDTVFLRIPEGTLPQTHRWKFVISHRVMDYLGNTLDGNGDGYIDGDSRDDYIMEL